MDATQPMEVLSGTAGDEIDDDYVDENASVLYASLTVENDAETGGPRTFSVFGGESKIGRDPDECHIVIRNKTLSRVHAIIDIDDLSSMTIHDNHSLNKTFRNDLQLKPDVHYALEGGELLSMGEVKLRFTIAKKQDEKAAEKKEEDATLAIKETSPESRKGPFLVPETPAPTKGSENNSTTSCQEKKTFSAIVPDSPNSPDRSRAGEEEDDAPADVSFVAPLGASSTPRRQEPVPAKKANIFEAETQHITNLYDQETQAIAEENGEDQKSVGLKEAKKIPPAETQAFTPAEKIQKPNKEEEDKAETVPEVKEPGIKSGDSAVPKQQAKSEDALAVESPLDDGQNVSIEEHVENSDLDKSDADLDKSDADRDPGKSTPLEDLATTVVLPQDEEDAEGEDIFSACTQETVKEVDDTLKIEGNESDSSEDLLSIEKTKPSEVGEVQEAADKSSVGSDSFFATPVKKPLEKEKEHDDTLDEAPTQLLLDNVEDVSIADEKEIVCGNDKEDIVVSNEKEDNGIADDKEDNGIADDKEDIGIMNETDDTGIVSKNDDVGNASKTEDIGSASKTEDIGSASKTEDIGSASKTEDIGSASKTEDIGSASKTEDIGSASETEDIGSASNNDVSASKNDVVSASEKEDICSASKKQDIGGASKKQEGGSADKNETLGTPEIIQDLPKLEVNSTETPHAENSPAEDVKDGVEKKRNDLSPSGAKDTSSSDLDENLDDTKIQDKTDESDDEVIPSSQKSNVLEGTNYVKVDMELTEPMPTTTKGSSFSPQAVMSPILKPRRGEATKVTDNDKELVANSDRARVDSEQKSMSASVQEKEKPKESSFLSFKKKIIRRTQTSLQSETDETVSTADSESTNHDEDILESNASSPSKSPEKDLRSNSPYSDPLDLPCTQEIATALSSSTRPPPSHPEGTEEQEKDESVDSKVDLTSAKAPALASEGKVEEVVSSEDESKLVIDESAVERPKKLSRASREAGKAKVPAKKEPVPQVQINEADKKAPPKMPDVPKKPAEEAAPGKKESGTVEVRRSTRPTRRSTRLTADYVTSREELKKPENTRSARKVAVAKERKDAVAVKKNASLSPSQPPLSSPQRAGGVRSRYSRKTSTPAASTAPAASPAASPAAGTVKKEKDATIDKKNVLNQPSQPPVPSPKQAGGPRSSRRAAALARKAKDAVTDKKNIPNQPSPPPVPSPQESRRLTRGRVVKATVKVEQEEEIPVPTTSSTSWRSKVDGAQKIAGAADTKKEEPIKTVEVEAEEQKLPSAKPAKRSRNMGDREKESSPPPAKRSTRKMIVVKTEVVETTSPRRRSRRKEVVTPEVEKKEEKKSVLPRKRGKKSTSEVLAKVAKGEKDSSVVQGSRRRSTRSLLGRQDSSSSLNTSTVSDASTSSSCSLRKKGGLKPVVMFTGYNSTMDKKFVTDLGGSLTEDPTECTVLVTDKVRRTAKFLSMVAKGIPIVKPTWLQLSKETKSFQDPWCHLVEDEKSEKKWGFNLRTTLKASAKSPLLTGFKVFATESVKPPPNELKEIVKFAGGSWLETLPSKTPTDVIIVSCQSDKPVRALSKKKAELTLYSTELLLSGLLTYHLDFNAHILHLSNK